MMKMDKTLFGEKGKSLTGGCGGMNCGTCKKIV